MGWNKIVVYWLFFFFPEVAKLPKQYLSVRSARADTCSVECSKCQYFGDALLLDQC